MPLMFDMPMEKLKTYQGRTPRPTDFDQYWEETLAELKNTPPDYELKEAMFSASCARCYHLFLLVWEELVFMPSCHFLLTEKNGIQRYYFFMVIEGTQETGMTNLVCFSRFCCCRYGLQRAEWGVSEDPGGVRGTTLYGHIIRGLSDSPDKLMYRSIFLDTVQPGKSGGFVA